MFYHLVMHLNHPPIDQDLDSIHISDYTILLENLSLF